MAFGKLSCALAFISLGEVYSESTHSLSCSPVSGGLEVSWLATESVEKYDLQIGVPGHVHTLAGHLLDGDRRSIVIDHLRANRTYWFQLFAAPSPSVAKSTSRSLSTRISCTGISPSALKTASNDDDYMTVQVVRMHTPAGDGLVNRNSANARGLALILGSPWGSWEGKCHMTMYKVYVRKEVLKKQATTQGLDGGYFANYMSCNNIGKFGYRCLPVNTGDCALLETNPFKCTAVDIREIHTPESRTHVGMAVVSRTGKKGRWYSTTQKGLEMKNWYMDSEYRTAECKRFMKADAIEKAFEGDMRQYFAPMDVDVSAFTRDEDDLDSADWYAKDDLKAAQSLSTQLV